jgi:hypothetical protein
MRGEPVWYIYRSISHTKVGSAFPKRTQIKVLQNNLRLRGPICTAESSPILMHPRASRRLRSKLPERTGPLPLGKPTQPVCQPVISLSMSFMLGDTAERLFSLVILLGSSSRIEPL